MTALPPARERPPPPSSTGDSGSEMGDETHRAKNVTYRHERKRNRDHLNDDILKDYMENFRIMISTSFEDQDNKFSSRLEDAVSEIKAQNASVNAELITINDGLTNIRSEIKSLENQYNEVMQSFTTMKSEQTRIVTQLDELVKSHKFDSELIKDVDSRLKKVEVAANPEKVESDINLLRSSVSKMQIELNEYQQRERQLNLEIFGIPESRNEDLIDITIRLANYAGVDLKHDNIIHATRIQPLVKVPDRPKSVVIKLRNRIDKDNILAGLRKKQLSTLDIQMPGESKRIFVNEHLTVSNKKIYKACRVAAAEKGFKYCWVKNCRIFLRKSDTSPIIHIKDESDMKKLR